MRRAPPENSADLLNAGQIHRAAVDVDDSLEEREALGGVGIDICGERLLFSCHGW